MCKHQYIIDLGNRAVKNSHTVRLCVQCRHAETFVDGRWIEFDTYLDSLDPSIDEAETLVTHSGLNAR